MPRHLRKFQKYKNVCRLFVHYLHWFLRNIEHFLMIPCNTEWTLYEGVYILFMWDGNGFRRRLVTPWPLKVIGIWPYPDPIWKLFPCIYVYIVYITPTTRTGPVSLPSYRTLTMLHFSSSTILNLFNRNPVYGLSWFTDSNIYI